MGRRLPYSNSGSNAMFRPSDAAIVSLFLLLFLQFASGFRTLASNYPRTPESNVGRTDLPLQKSSSESKVYIVYTGRPHEHEYDHIELITSSHHQMLASVLGSNEAAAKSMIYSYRHGFSGFAAQLTKLQAQEIAGLPGVLDVVPDQLYKIQTTRSWDYLGVSLNSTDGILQKTTMGNDTIIGLLDTGISPEEPSFKDDGVGPIPLRWKGTCVTGVDFNATNCNKKIIGARYFSKGFEIQYLSGNPIDPRYDSASARDRHGHGTHTASTAAGNIVNFRGPASGKLRGGAPLGRLAIYKVAWYSGIITGADALMALDEAISDGVDVLSLSLGHPLPLYADIDTRNILASGTFHAAKKGIVVVCSGGNSGPTAGTVGNVMPWVVTVGASSIDRSFPTTIILGDGQSFTGYSIFLGSDTSMTRLTTPTPDWWECSRIEANHTYLAGSVVFCFHTGSILTTSSIRRNVASTGAVGLIISQNPSTVPDTLVSANFPTVQVDFEIGTQILSYIRYTSGPRVRIRASETVIGRPISTKVAVFSSRGPNALSPAILKPDIAAPGVGILAAVPGGVAFMSGTSMAAPHVSSIAALVKYAHPSWSPAAIKSALLTTAWSTDPSSGQPIFAEGATFKLADPFDLGSGIMNPNAAIDPGLVYDLTTTDYIHYLCSMGYGYNDTSISAIVGQNISCSGSTISILNLNLPSITIPDLTSSVTVTRTVTNVGPVLAQYKASIQPPEGITVEVNPNVLEFSSRVRELSFTVNISTSYKFNTGYYFGSLTWIFGDYRVRSPISVKTDHPEN